MSVGLTAESLATRFTREQLVDLVTNHEFLSVVEDHVIWRVRIDSISSVPTSMLRGPRSPPLPTRRAFEQTGWVTQGDGAGRGVGGAGVGHAGSPAELQRLGFVRGAAPCK